VLPAAAPPDPMTTSPLLAAPVVLFPMYMLSPAVGYPAGVRIQFVEANQSDVAALSAQFTGAAFPMDAGTKRAAVESTAIKSPLSNQFLEVMFSTFMV